MAVLPTPEDAARAILACMANEYNLRPDETAPMLGVQMKLHPKFDTDEFNAGLALAESNGWIAFAPPNFIKLTAEGFKEA